MRKLAWISYEKKIMFDEEPLHTPRKAPDSYRDPMRQNVLVRFLRPEGIQI